MTPGLGSVTTAQVAPPPQALHDTKSRQLSRGEVLYHAGDDAQASYRLEEGLVKLSVNLLSGRERIVSLAGPGDFVGALTGAPYHTENAEALSATVRVSVIPKEVAGMFQSELFAATRGQLRQLRDTLEDTDLSVSARLARTLVRLGDRFGHTSEAGRVHLTLPLTHDTFAAIIGAARETTTAGLSELRAAGVLRGTRGRYSFDRPLLSAYAHAAAQ